MAFLAPIAGGLLGAALGGMTGSKQNTTTQVQRSDPWVGVQPYLSGEYRDAWNAPYPEYYPGQLVADPSQATNWSQAAILQRAQGGDPTLNAANRSVQGTLNGNYLANLPGQQQLNSIGRGDYLYSNPAMGMLGRIGSGAMLNSNPWLDAMFGRAASSVGDTFKNNVMPGIAGMFSSAGRYGSNSMDTALGTAEKNYGRTLGDLATSIYGGNYANERGLQQQALGTMGGLYQGERGLQNNALGISGDMFGRERGLMGQMAGLAPGLQQAGYMPLQLAGQVGAAQDLRNQAGIDAAKQRWDYQTNATRDRLSWLNSLYSGAAPYATRSNTGSSGVNPILGAMGGFAIGNSIQNAMPSNLFGGGSSTYPGSGGWGTGDAFGNMDYGLFI